MLQVRIGQYDRYPDPYFVDRDSYAMHLVPEVLKSVAFVGIKENGKFLPRATAFFVHYTEDQHRFCHLVTAEHVISGLITKGHDIWIRLNVAGEKSVDMLIPDAASVFRYHPNNENEPTDVAVCPFSPSFFDEKTGETVNFDIVFLSLQGADGFLPSDEFSKRVIGLGAEIAIVGLFRSHYGANRNIPIVRVGNISAMPGEPISTKYVGYIKAYLVEARSIAGLSGSPVLVFPDPAVFLAEGITKGRIDQQGAALLGLMHGHFDVPNLNEDVVTDEDAPNHGVHTGIGVVVPVEKIVETLKHPELTAMRKATVARMRKERGATADTISDGASTSAPESDANPNHLGDFKRLVDVAARKRPQGDQT